MMANMATRVQVARHLVYHTAWRKDSGARHSMETALAKLYASETAMWTTAKAVQIHGGMDIPSIFLERYMRDAKITEIYEGANEVQRIVIAVATLKQAGAE
jgi:alkylation response protein AidB-like acyl-CoA dehydrogenase